MSTMSRAQFKRSLQEGVHTHFGMELERRPEQWKQIYDERTSRKAWEELVLRIGLGGVAKKQEGGPVSYDTGADGWNRIMKHDTWALAFAITEEAQEDNLYGDLGRQYGQALARSFIHTREINSMELLNNSTDGTNYPVGDGVSLLNTSHPLYNGETYQNKLTTDADLSEAALEDLITIISLWDDDRGIPQVVRPQALMIHPTNWAVAERLLMTSKGRPGTADNDVAVLPGRFPGGIKEFHYQTNTKQYGILTDAQDGFIMFRRAPLKRGIEGDFETGNMRYKGRERYKFDVFNPRIYAGSVGG